MTIQPTRRDLLAGGVGAGLSLPFANSLAPRWLWAQAPEDTILVVLQLRGGMDMAQAIVNPDEPKYIAARPKLKQPKAKMLRLTTTGSLYLHPKLAAFKALFDRGDLAIVQGVGYPKPNFSHFRSMDIWATADTTATSAYSGWIGAYLSKLYTGAFSIPAMDFESKLNRVFSGHPIPVFRSPSTFKFLFDTSTAGTRVDQKLELALLEANAKVLRPSADPNLKFIADALGKTPSDVNLIQTGGSTYVPKVTYPSTTSRQRLLSTTYKLAARYITGGLKTQIYYHSLGGFDNHSNEVDALNPQAGTFADLVEAFSTTTKAFLDDIAAHGFGKKVVVFLWSEFSRRAGENGNLGTDHGAASVSFLAGAPVIGGLYGAYPSWAKISSPYTRANFEFTTDFRSVYATIMDKYWGVTSSTILGKQYPLIGFF